MAAFKSRFLVDIYRLSFKGYSDKYIAKQLGITGGCLSQWKNRFSNVRYAIDLAMQDRKDTEEGSMSEYIRGKLSVRMQKVWDRISEWEMERSGYAKIKKLLENKGTKFRQKLLIYALIATGFDQSKALKKVAIPRRTFNRWKETDPYFTELMGEVEQCQKDFYENALVRLVKDGDSSAIRFVNRTKNRDRGYGEKTEIEANVNVGITTIPVGELELPLEVRRAILEAMDKYQNKRKRVESRTVQPLLPSVQEQEGVVV